MVFTRKRPQTSKSTARLQNLQKTKDPKPPTAGDAMELDRENSKNTEPMTEEPADEMQTSTEQLQPEPHVTSEFSTNIARKAIEVLDETSNTKDRCEDAEPPDDTVTGFQGTDGTPEDELVEARAVTPNLGQSPIIPILDKDSPIHPAEVLDSEESQSKSPLDNQRVEQDGNKDATDGCESQSSEELPLPSRPVEVHKSASPEPLPPLASIIGSLSSKVAVHNSGSQGAKRKSPGPVTVPIYKDGDNPNKPIVIDDKPMVIDDDGRSPKRKQKKVRQVSEKDALEGESMRMGETKDFMKEALRLQEKLIEHDKEDETRVIKRRRLQAKAVRAVKDAITHIGLERIGTK